MNKMDMELKELLDQFKQIHGIDVPLGDWFWMYRDKAAEAIKQCLRPMSLRECVRILGGAGLLNNRELGNPINALIEKYIEPYPFSIPEEIRQIWDEYLAEIEANWRDG